MYSACSLLVKSTVCFALFSFSYQEIFYQENLILSRNSDSATVLRTNPHSLRSCPFSSFSVDSLHGHPAFGLASWPRPDAKRVESKMARWRLKYKESRRRDLQMMTTGTARNCQNKPCPRMQQALELNQVYAIMVAMKMAL